MVAVTWYTFVAVLLDSGDDGNDKASSPSVMIVTGNSGHNVGAAVIPVTAVGAKVRTVPDDGNKLSDKSTVGASVGALVVVGLLTFLAVGAAVGMAVVVALVGDCVAVALGAAVDVVSLLLDPREGSGLLLFPGDWTRLEGRNPVVAARATSTSAKRRPV